MKKIILSLCVFVCGAYASERQQPTPPLVERPSIDPSSLPDTPMELFQEWRKDAEKKSGVKALYFSLATVDKNCHPHVRTMALRTTYPDEIIFTSLSSRGSAIHIKSRPKVAALFYWSNEQRQVRIRGTAIPLSQEKQAAVFAELAPPFQVRGNIQANLMQANSHDEAIGHAKTFYQELGMGKIQQPESFIAYGLAIEEMEFYQLGDKHIPIRVRFACQKDGSWEKKILFY